MFSGSATRTALYRDWRVRREDIFAIAVPDYEWVDGSFVSLKRDPADIDVVTFIDGAVIEALSVDDRKRLLEPFLAVNHLGTKLATGCDGYLVIVRPVGHPERSTYESWADYWNRWWSQDRAGVAKGYLDVRGDP